MLIVIGNRQIHRGNDLDWWCSRWFLECFDTQVQLDRLEEQICLPAAFVESADGVCGQRELIGEKDELFPVSGSLKRMRRR